MSWDIEQATQALAAEIESKATSMEDAIRNHLTSARDELQKDARGVLAKLPRLRALIDLLTHPQTKVAHTSAGQVVVTNPDMPIGIVQDHDFKPLKVEGQPELALVDEGAAAKAAPLPPVTVVQKLTANDDQNPTPPRAA